jgi:hypothetical protein
VTIISQHRTVPRKLFQLQLVNYLKINCFKTVYLYVCMYEWMILTETQKLFFLYGFQEQIFVIKTLKSWIWGTTLMLEYFLREIYTTKGWKMSRLARQETMDVALTASSFQQQVKFFHSKFKCNLSDTSFKCLKYNHTNIASIPFIVPMVQLGTSWLWTYRPCTTSHKTHGIHKFSFFPKCSKHLTSHHLYLTSIAIVFHYLCNPKALVISTGHDIPW